MQVSIGGDQDRDIPCEGVSMEVEQEGVLGREEVLEEGFSQDVCHLRPP